MSTKPSRLARRSAITENFSRSLACAKIAPHSMLSPSRILEGSRVESSDHPPARLFHHWNYVANVYFRHVPTEIIATRYHVDNLSWIVAKQIAVVLTSPRIVHPVKSISYLNLLKIILFKKKSDFPPLSTVWQAPNMSRWWVEQNREIEEYMQIYPVSVV